MRIGTLFSGIGSPEQGAKRVYGDKLELVFACEWDKYARESFKANYEIEDKHFHIDINDMDGKQYKNNVDIIIGGSPCQDFSIAGLRAGIDGKRGQLIWQYYRIITEIMPPVFIYENVKGMVSDKGGRTLQDFLTVFRELGYFCHYEVLNTKDYGIPQNRERIFIIGFLDHEQYYRFQFAPKTKLTKRLKDILEPNVDEKYYLNKKLISALENHKERHQKKGNGFVFEPKTVYSVDGVAPTIPTGTGGNQEPKILQRGRGFNKGGEHTICPTLTINSFQENNHLQEENYRIRKLTPRECFRLQDFPDTFKFVVSNTQLYKQAGNSISVNMMEMIFNQIEKSRTINLNGGLF